MAYRAAGIGSSRLVDLLAPASIGAITKTQVSRTRNTGQPLMLWPLATSCTSASTQVPPEWLQQHQPCRLASGPLQPGRSALLALPGRSASRAQGWTEGLCSQAGEGPWGQVEGLVSFDPFSPPWRPTVRPVHVVTSLVTAPGNAGELTALGARGGERERSSIHGARGGERERPNWLV